MIQVRIKDAYAELDATAFEEACIELVGMTVDELSTLDDDEGNAVYTELEKMVDKDYFLSLRTSKSKVGEGNTNLTISRAWADESSVAKIPRITATEGSQQ